MGYRLVKVAGSIKKETIVSYNGQIKVATCTKSFKTVETATKKADLIVEMALEAGFHVRYMIVPVVDDKQGIRYTPVFVGQAAAQAGIHFCDYQVVA
jgi:hypothetical protein